MSAEHSSPGHMAFMQPFGPVKPHLSDHREDHERGWQEPLEAPAGRIPRVREVSRVPLAEQFRERLREAPTGHAEDR